MADLMQHYDLASYRSEFAEIHFLIGEAYLAKGDAGRAINKFRTSLVLMPKSVWVRATLAELYLKKGMRKEAQREFGLVMEEINRKR